MIEVNCDMKKITEKHKIYIIEYTVPNYFDSFNKATDSLKEYLIEFMGEDKTNILERLVTLCIENDLEKIISKEKCVRNKIYSDKNNYNEVKQFWDKVLNYSSFANGIKKGKAYSITWNRHLFIEMTNVKICPYCNRNYITSYVDKDDDVRTTASIDHYYLKSQYPFLQLNIFNMVPSCTVCNSYTKGNKANKHLNPYLDKSSIFFEIDSSSIEGLYPNMKGKNHIRVTSGRDSKSRESIKVFKLSEIYETHNNVVNELQQKIMDYINFSEDYYTKLLGIDIGISNLHNNWFDFLDKEENDEALIKLKKDIYKQIMD